MNPVLAIFAKNPTPGQVKTRLTPPLTPRQAAELYHCMLVDTVTRVKALGVESIIFHDGGAGFFRSAFPGMRLVPQAGACLGTRLENAFDVMAELGYRERVVIGTDAPDLPLPFIGQSFELLASGTGAVFGPSEDGGYYLVGIRGGYGTLFKEVPWSGPQVLSTSLDRAQESGLQAGLLPSWYDVDSFEDLARPGLTDLASQAPLTRDFVREYAGGRPMAAISA
ncbi:TIGR04282 family arsenosugar biosynthesis glycosyltransferase [Geomonas sp. Red32]|uniref:TIGR04282 family arsenosugar biosynthesis glycosyltransferase n=1 Tax=Geomonas sp. Red32 TaxID=2912856 RepID=UPI00202CA931|nr:TIGR04282 family arsenosugar biosynthesis glycosyltransferase [Geomonas sp. Red32]MCM0081220.1 TIGR04282 family arsenosugar biosynthesis glycosyltransferase [Geomonas sp. Red32]